MKDNQLKIINNQKIIIVMLLIAILSNFLYFFKLNIDDNKAIKTKVLDTIAQGTSIPDIDIDDEQNDSYINVDYERSKTKATFVPLIGNVVSWKDIEPANTDWDITARGGQAIKEDTKCNIYTDYNTNLTYISGLSEEDYKLVPDCRFFIRFMYDDITNYQEISQDKFLDIVNNHENFGYKNEGCIVEFCDMKDGYDSDDIRHQGGVLFLCIEYYLK